MLPPKETEGEGGGMPEACRWALRHPHPRNGTQASPIPPQDPPGRERVKRVLYCDEMCNVFGAKTEADANLIWGNAQPHIF